MNLSNKYGVDLDQVIPSATRQISEAHQRLKTLRAAPRAGAPKVWIQAQLVRLWIWVRALQIEDPKLTDRDACKRLALDGYEVWAHDDNSIVVEDVWVVVTGPEHLRRRLADAKQSLRGYDDVIREVEQEAQDLVQDRAIEAHADFISEAIRERPEITLGQLQERLAFFGFQATLSTIKRFVRRERDRMARLGVRGN